MRMNYIPNCSKTINLNWITVQLLINGKENMLRNMRCLLVSEVINKLALILCMDHVK